MPPASLRRWGPWTVGRSWTQASHNSGRLIKVLIDRNGPCCKKPTQRLQLCYATDLGKEMPASPCPFPHWGSSVSAERDTTLAHARASSSWLPVVIWVCFIGMKKHPWRLLCIRLLGSWTRQRYAPDYTRTPIHLQPLLLALFWLHVDGGTSCAPHLCIFILPEILTLFAVLVATRWDDWGIR